MLKNDTKWKQPRNKQVEPQLPQKLHLTFRKKKRKISLNQTCDDLIMISTAQNKRKQSLT